MIGTAFNKLFQKRMRQQERGDGSYFLVAGLGNPEKKYEGTRHNAGFAVIDVLADTYAIALSTTQKRAAVGKGVVEGEKVLLAKPLTYMNASGEAVRALSDYYKIDTTDHLIVISDDVDLPVGTIRIRKQGSAGGHNGLKDIIRHLGHEQFIRVRVGVGGKPAGKDMIGHVLGSVPKEERDRMDAAISQAAKAVSSIIKDGADKAMNLYNAKPKENTD